MMGNELHFYPGQNLLILSINGKKFKTYEAWGGPKVGKPSVTMPIQPTTPGKYVILRIETYITGSWNWSKIKWGTILKDKGSLENDVWYKLGRFKSWTKPFTSLSNFYSIPNFF